MFVVIVEVLRGGAQQEIDHRDQSGHEGKSAEQQEENAAQMQMPAVGMGGLRENDKQQAEEGTASGVEPHGTCPRLHGIPGNVRRFFLLRRTELDEVAEADNVAKGNDVGEQCHQ